MKCDQLMQQLATGPRSAEAVLEHLDQCEACRSRWAAAGMLSESAGEPPAGAEDCTRTDELLAWWDGSLTPPATADLMAHLDRCSFCLAELTRISRDVERLEAAEALGPLNVPADLEDRAIALVAQRGAAPDAMTPSLDARGTSRRRTWYMLPAAAGLVFVALGLGLLLTGREPFGSDGGVDVVARGGERAARSGLDLVAPIDGAEVGGELKFSWTADDPATEGRRYRLVVMDIERGATWIDVVTDRTDYAPSRVELDRLRAGGSYHWIIEPLGPGAGDPSEAGGFTVNP